MKITEPCMRKSIALKQLIILSMLLLVFVLENNFSQNLKLVWADEFNDETLDKTKWEYDIGMTNDNIHYYTDRTENVSVINGVLNITALREYYQGLDYTSGLIKTAGISYWRYGRVEARIKLPGTNGFVPAFWMLPEENIYGW